MPSSYNEEDDEPTQPSGATKDKVAIELSRSLSLIMAPAMSDSFESHPLGSSTLRWGVPGPDPIGSPRRAARGPVIYNSDNSAPDQELAGPCPTGGPRRAKRGPRKPRRIDSTTPEEEDNAAKPDPVPVKRARRKVPPKTGTSRPPRRRRVMQLRRVRTEWPLVDGKDPLVTEILAEIRTPRRPHDNTKYQLPVRPKLPSTAELLFDEYLAECGTSRPPTPSPTPTPTPTPPPRVHLWADEDGPEWTRSMSPWLLPLDVDVDADADADSDE